MRCLALATLALTLLPTLASAAPTTLVRCTVPLSHDGGAEHAVPGWGADEAEATAAARRAARMLAVATFSRDSWVVAMTDAGAGTGMHAFADRPSIDPALGATGWTQGEASCAAAELPEGAPATWQVTWPGAAEPIVRAEPAVAIDAARRRACLVAYSAELSQAFQALAVASAETRHEMMRVAFTAAGGTLSTCWTADPAIGAGAAAPAPATPDAAWYECDRWGVEIGQGALVVARGWGTSLERAKERALAEHAELTILRGSQTVFQGLALAPPDQRQQMIAVGISTSLLPVTPGLDGAERSSLVCRAVDEGGAIAWVPSPRLQQDCSKGGWPRLGGAGADAATSAVARETMCGAELTTLIPELHAALANADPDQRDELTAHGWSAGLACSVDCRAAAAVATVSRPARHEDDLDMSSEEAVRELARQALAERRPGLLAALMPAQLDHAPGFSWMMEQLTEGDPIPEDQLDAAVAQFQAAEFGGRWYLLPPR